MTQDIAHTQVYGNNLQREKQVMFACISNKANCGYLQKFISSF